MLLSFGWMHVNYADEKYKFDLFELLVEYVFYGIV